MLNDHFFSADEDEQLEIRNDPFWESLIGHVRNDCQDESVRSILDIGCHYGGLMGRIIKEWNPQRAWGIEPLERARRRAVARLTGVAPDVRLLDVVEWPELPNNAFDLVTCHEVLYLEPNLRAFMANVCRVLSPSGRAYIVLGCHAENPTWSQWKPKLEARGHRVYDHYPMDILEAGASHGLLPSLRPLRETGWITHNPLRSEFGFANAGAMLDHHFKHKLLFRFMRP